MENIQNTELLDFLAEGFLQQGASVTYTQIGGASALKVITQDDLPRIYVPADDEVSKMKFQERFSSEEIIIPVLKSDEEFRLRSLLKRAGIATVKVQRLSLPDRFAWYSRKLMWNI